MLTALSNYQGDRISVKEAGKLLGKKPHTVRTNDNYFPGRVDERDTVLVSDVKQFLEEHYLTNGGTFMKNK